VNTFLALFIISLCASLVITPVLRRLCERFNWLDVPKDARRIHEKAVPRLGGVAIFASLFLALMLLPFVHNLLTQALRTNLSRLYSVLIPATLMLIFGAAQMQN
jgi:UDP-N-acetylmuramyl pentapeptide phosphotransferase/UDP-N-acetylglucosamine-1-phosphate transferase